MKTEDFFSRFEKIALFHVGRFAQPSFDDYLMSEQHDWAALKLFVRGYAFEHSGRVPLFPLLAEEICSELSVQGWELRKSKTAAEAWERFKKSAKAYKLNPMNNPLAPRDIEFRQRGKKHRTQGCSAIEFVCDADRGDIISWTRTMLNNRVREAHSDLISINGIGNKIASLWLRDVAVRFGVMPYDKDDRWLLFPVDIWVRRIVAILTPNKKFKNDEDVAKWCVKECGETFSPEKVNMGFWYFGAQIAETEDLMKKALKDNQLKRFDELVSEHHRRLRGAVKQYEADSSSAVEAVEHLPLIQ
ncbi:MAG: hypothetical protein EYC68_07180 [Chloroflexota bacterium]|nr:MAG: hypothetical protein EYC68_07180 [Chloroflexota bacterium]